MVYDHLCREPSIYPVETLWVCSLPFSHAIDIVYTRHMPGIYYVFMPGIYYVYDM
jgi:hypothetical protein